jgi:phenylpropionate dioxygenase-like ring-hydroxylating dioxygenase large terminal subunit
VYPNTGLNVFPGPPNLSIGPIAPNGTGRTERYLDYFFAPSVDEEWRREFFAFDDQIGREDTALVESVQRGMSAGIVEHGRLLLDAEPLLAAFQSWVADRIG